VSLSISSLLVFSSGVKLAFPVTLPPGCARLATKPEPTGSTEAVITMGMVLVAFFAANGVSPPETTIRSTLRRTRSAASSDTRSGPLFSADRYSMVRFFPSIHPSLRISCQNASHRTALPEAVLGSRKPMRGTFPVCCASAQMVKSKIPTIKTALLTVFSPLRLTRLLDRRYNPCHGKAKARNFDRTDFSGSLRKRRSSAA